MKTETSVVRQQAEEVFLNGPVITSNHPSSNSTYTENRSSFEDFTERTVGVTEASDYDLSIQNANGSGQSSQSFSNNGTTQSSALEFDSIGKVENGDIVIEASPSVASTNFDQQEVSTADVPSAANVPSAPNVFISNESAKEGFNDFLVFKVSLSTKSTEEIVLDLAATDGTARGLVTDFDIDPAGEPIDYTNREFEVSSDGERTWQTAQAGTQIAFAPGQTRLKVRLAIHNDQVIEPTEKLSLQVTSVLAGNVNNILDTGSGSIYDNDLVVDNRLKPISLLPYTDIRLEGDYNFSFNGADGGLVDKDGESLGFTMVSPSSKPDFANSIADVVGYLPENLDVEDSKLRITTTSGLQIREKNSQDNALGVGLNVPSKRIKLAITLVDLPTAVGGAFTGRPLVWAGRQWRHRY